MDGVIGEVELGATGFARQIRAYNGSFGRDSIGRKILNEFELATTATGLLDLRVDERTRVGTAHWRRVAISRRTKGQPDYVSKVLASPST